MASENSVPDLTLYRVQFNDNGLIGVGEGRIEFLHGQYYDLRCVLSEQPPEIKISVRDFQQKHDLPQTDAFYAHVKPENVLSIEAVKQGDML